MADKDTVTKNYTKDNRVFADIVNLALYGGRPVVKPDDISELDAAELHVLFASDPGDRKPETVQKYRDILKKVTVHDETFIAHIIVGVENQSAVHYAMPVRGMLYDALSYAKQVAELTKVHRESGEKMEPAEFLSGLKKNDRLMPVKTIVVSYDADKWDGALSLHEMIDWTGIPGSVKEQVADYTVTLIQPCDLDDEILKSLPSSFGQTMGFIKYSGNAENLQRFMSENEEAFRRFPLDALAVLEAFCRLDCLEIEENEEGGGCDMCKALEDIMEQKINQGRIEGRNEGIALGRNEGIALGRREGIALGMSRGQITALANLVVNGLLSLEDALSVTGLTKEEFINEATELNIIIKLK